MKYSEVFRLNFELFNANGIWEECFRQWLVIALSLLVIPYLLVAIRQLRQFYHGKFTFEQLILVLEMAKVSRSKQPVNCSL